MFHFSVFRRSEFSCPSGDYRLFRLHPVVALPFLAGLIGGCVVGLVSDAPQELLISSGLITVEEGGLSFLHAFWHASRFVLTAAFLSSGITGLFFLPFLSALRAFSFSCSVAAALRPTSACSVILPFLSLGVPALLEFPGFLIAETEGFGFSRRLALRQRLPSDQSRPQLRRLLFILLICIADAGYICFLMPRLIAMFS